MYAMVHVSMHVTDHAPVVCVLVLMPPVLHVMLLYTMHDHDTADACIDVVVCV